jgi:hypothetical protein
MMYCFQLLNTTHPIVTQYVKGKHKNRQSQLTFSQLFNVRIALHVLALQGAGTLY